MKTRFIILLLALLSFAFTPREKTWVAIGDSITYLNDHPDETGNRVTKGYLSRVVEKLPDLHYINQGHNGWTSGGIAEHIDELGLVKADLYTVFLGTNDWWAGRPLGSLPDYTNNTGNGTVYGSFRIIMNKLRSLNPEAAIVLITPMQRADFVYIGNMKNNAYGSYEKKNDQSLAEFAEALKKIGKYDRLPVVDLYNKSGMKLTNLVNFKRLRDPESGVYKDYTYPQFINKPFNPETDKYPYPAEAINMTYDGLHPSDKGNEVIAGMLIKEFKKLKKLRMSNE